MAAVAAGRIEGWQQGVGGSVAAGVAAVAADRIEGAADRIEGEPGSRACQGARR